MKDRRQYERIDISAPCRMSTAGIRSCDGVTENISRNGLSFRINGNSKKEILEIGDFLAVDILLPERRTFGQKSLRCRGSVVRLTSVKGGARVAVAVEHMMFRSVGEGRSKAAPVNWDEIAFRA